MPVIAVTIVDQTVAVTQVGEIGPIGPAGIVSAAGDGTAAAPSISFATDLDTGFWRPGVNLLAASTGGVERARVDASGNVGIGTTGPAAKLHVSTTADGEMARFRRENGTNNVGVFFYANDATSKAQMFASGASGALDLGLGAAGAEVITIKGSGNVGIGTSSPTAILHTYVTGTGNKTGLILGRNTSNVSDTLSLVFNVADLGDQASIAATPTGAATGDLVFATRVSSAVTEKMRIAASGNVGIGTTSPFTTLDAAGAGVGGSGWVSRFGNAGGTVGVLAGVRGGIAAIGTQDALNLALNPDGGNVGIGTTSPDVFARGYSGRILGVSSASGQSALGLNSASGSAAYLDLGVNGTRSGSIYADASTFEIGALTSSINLSLTTNGSSRLTIGATTGHVTPGADNTQNFGSGSLRWATIYAGTGTINTSDQRYKVLREGGDLTDAEFAAWSNVRAIVYQDKDSFERKGSAARLHIGYSWQSIQAAFEAQGLDARRYGLWCEDALEAPVEKTRMVSRPVEGQTETIPVLDDDGKPVFEQVQETEEVEQSFEEVRMIDGAPVLVKGVRTVAQPVFDSVQIRDEDGKLIFDTAQPIEDPETGELVEGDPIPRMAPVPRMIRKAKTETVPVMEEVEETYTEMEPTGETRGALRYNQCSVIEAAWLRRELASVVARLSALEAA